MIIDNIPTHTHPPPPQKKKKLLADQDFLFLKGVWNRLAVRMNRLARPYNYNHSVWFEAK